MKLPHEHPQRRELNQEAHARPPESLQAPLRISFLALYATGEVAEAAWRHVQALVRSRGLTPPGDGANHFSADLGSFRLKAERHSEFLRFKFIVSGTGKDPFQEPAILAVPPEWLAELPGELLVASNVALLPASQVPLDADRIADRWFGGNSLVAASIGAGAAQAYTDFRLHGDNFGRILLLDRTMSSRQAGRMVQRLLEIDTYRMLAMLGFPLARRLVPLLNRGEHELAEITRALIPAQASDEPGLFDRLSRLEAEIESQQSESMFRFSASAAYDKLVQRRIMELREDRLPGLQTFQEFTERRLAPAMMTCQSVADRQERLSLHLARVTQLLSTRVDLSREAQTQGVLASMDRRARIQLRLQETVEGLSVAAITYYIVGLVGYLAKGAKAAGIDLDVEVVVALSIPLTALLIALALRRLRKSLAHEP
jgi:uncharacterized membrane-anchored protein